MPPAVKDGSRRCPVSCSAAFVVSACESAAHHPQSPQAILSGGFMTSNCRKIAPWLVLAVALFLSVAPVPAFAYSAEQQQACTGDAFQFCGPEIPGRRSRHRLHDPQQGATFGRLPGAFQAGFTRAVGSGRPANRYQAGCPQAGQRQACQCQACECQSEKAEKTRQTGRYLILSRLRPEGARSGFSRPARATV